MHDNIFCQHHLILQKFDENTNLWNFHKVTTQSSCQPLSPAYFLVFEFWKYVDVITFNGEIFDLESRMREGKSVVVTMCLGQWPVWNTLGHGVAPGTRSSVTPGHPSRDQWPDPPASMLSPLLMALTHIVLVSVRTQDIGTLVYHGTRLLSWLLTESNTLHTRSMCPYHPPLITLSHSSENW